MNKTSLVLGGAGYIGSHTCKALSLAGYTPVVYDHHSKDIKKAVQWGPYEHGDTRDKDRLKQVFEKYKPGSILYFAGHVGVEDSVKNPDKYYDNNLGGLLTTLTTAREFGIKEILFSSSAAIYGNPKTNPIKENFPKNPISPYAASKLMSEKILEDCATPFGFRAVSLRYFNAAGADPGGQIGPDIETATHLIPLVLKARFDPSYTLKLFGTDYDTPDGTAVRDYIHVADLGTAHVAALKYLEAGGETNAFNLGTGQGYSVREVINAVEKVFPGKVKIVEECRRSGDLETLVADPTKAGDILGWKPEISDLETIVKTTGDWMLKEQ